MFALGMSAFELASASALPRGGEDFHALRNGPLPRAALPQLDDAVYSLLCALVAEDPATRPTAVAVLAHPSLAGLEGGGGGSAETDALRAQVAALQAALGTRAAAVEAFCAALGARQKVSPPSAAVADAALTASSTAAPPAIAAPSSSFAVSWAAASVPPSDPATLAVSGVALAAPGGVAAETEGGGGGGAGVKMLLASLSASGASSPLAPLAPLAPPAHLSIADLTASAARPAVAPPNDVPVKTAVAPGGVGVSSPLDALVGLKICTPDAVNAGADDGGWARNVRDALRTLAAAHAFASPLA
jgi:hypothetical protein